MPSKLVERVEREAGLPGLADALSNRVPASDLQSLLLEVLAARSEQVTVPDILARSRCSPLLAPSTLDARIMNRFDRVAFDTACEFDAVDLSPVCCFGAEKQLGGLHQNNVLTALRNAEVLGDSTPAMAIECALRRREPSSRNAAVRLCSSHRVIRLQPFDVPGFTPHFRLFGLVSAGRDAGSLDFERRHLAEHISFYLSLFRALNSEGFHMTDPLVEISDPDLTAEWLASQGVGRDEVREAVRAHRIGSSEQFLKERGLCPPEPSAAARDLEQAILEPLRLGFPEAEFRFDLSRLEGVGYYRGLSLRISPTAPDGVRYPIVDGGITDWTARLLNDRKERLLTSGIGSEFACRKYRV